MKFWLDTEFLENGKTIKLISIGIVAEDGREFYGETEGARRLARSNPWLRENVLPHLSGPALTTEQIAERILHFCDPSSYGKPEFWGYYADYDWVVFCWLFGRMIDLPKGFPMYCRDIKQWADQLENPTLPGQASTGEHNALEDARWNKMAWQFLADAEKAADER